MTFWAGVGLFSVVFAGFVLYWRALSEIKSAAGLVDAEELEDTALLAALTPLARALVGPDVVLVEGDAAFLHEPDGPIHLLGLPIRTTRDLARDERLSWHGHQLACVSAWNELARPGKAEDRDARIADFLATELPGVRAGESRLVTFENNERALTPSYEVVVAITEDRVGGTPTPDATSEPDEPTPPRLARRGRRVDPRERKQGFQAGDFLQVEYATRELGTSVRSDDAESSDDGLDGASLSPLADETGRPATQAIASVSSPPPAESLGTSKHVYDEWYVRATSYRKRHCRVTETPVEASEAGRAWRERLAERRASRREIERILMTLAPLPERRRREPAGDDLDLDAFVRARTDLLAGRTPDERIFEQRVLRRRSVFLGLLIDWSASGERWVGSARAFDLGQEAAALFSSALAELGDAFSVYGFSGQGRGDVQVGRLKGYDEMWSNEVLSRFGSVGPGRFTRIGAAMRHVTRRMESAPAAQRLLLVFSDARPQDDDGYDGTYAVADVRQAVREARRLGIRPFCLALGDEARGHLPAMFGRDWALHDDPETLGSRLARLYATLTSAG